MNITSRQCAINSGEKRFFTGEQCRHGHIAETDLHEGCVECKKVRNAKYREKNLLVLIANDVIYQRVNKEKIKEKKAKIYYANLEAMHEKSRAWRAENIHKANKSSKDWRESNPEKFKELFTTWKLKNPGAMAVYKHNRRARIKQGGKLSIGISEKLFKLQKGKCACCGNPLGVSYHMDHIMPLSRGGLNVDSNIQLLTASCNHQKRAKDPVDFMQSRGFLL